MSVKLDNRQHHTLERIFAHPIAHNLYWNEVEHLLVDLGEVGETHTGHLSVTINGVAKVVTGRRNRELTADQVVELRHILQEFQLTPEATARD